MISPTEVDAAGIGIAVMVFSIITTLALLGLQGHVIRKTNSTAIKADSLHYKTDLLVNGSVIVALWLSIQGWAGFDALFAGAIALYILFSAREIMVISYDHLMDRELPDEQRDLITQLVLEHSGARGMHDLRSRQSGTMTFIQLHLELDDDMALLDAHQICDEIEARLMAAFPESEIIIHIDPQSVVGIENVADFN